jgi:hypothetical protein
VAQASPPADSEGRRGRLRHLEPAQRRQIAFITLGALAVFALFRWLPTGTNLSHMDFRVTATNQIDFCDPLSPQFIPVVAVASPVSMTLATDGTAARPNEPARITVTLRTSTGKSIAPVDLLVTHTRKLHLLIVDPWLDDYQHIHPEPGRIPGEWTFTFTPRREGTYRVFADFTPLATGRGLYASADWQVGPPGLPAGFTMVMEHETSWVAERDGCRFTLAPLLRSVTAGRPTDLKLSIVRTAGGAVSLSPVMGAYAHLVAFDEARSGFAHLHPVEADLTRAPAAVRPELNFKITIPRAGRYVIWAQVVLRGRETFVPFWFDVVP